MPVSDGPGFGPGELKEQGEAAVNIIEYANDFLDKTRDGELSHWEQGEIMRDSLDMLADATLIPPVSWAVDQMTDFVAFAEQPTFKPEEAQRREREFTESLRRFMLGINEFFKDIGMPGPPGSTGELPPPPPPTPPVPRRDPLALDLDDSGTIETLSKEDGVFFDLDNSGFAEETSWVAPSDGFLVLDRNQNQVIDGGAELFGTETMLASGNFAKNGYEALAEFDDNGDGAVTSADGIFEDLRIWRDLNSDGVANDGELQTLAELGVDSISTSYETNVFTDSNNVEHREEGDYTRVDGSSGLTNTLWFESDRRNTVPVEIHSGEGISVSEDIEALPNAVGFGNAYSLHHAIVLDESGELRSKVDQFISEQDSTARKALVREILIFWAGQEDTLAESRGTYMDGQRLGVLETFWGQPALQQSPTRRYAQNLDLVYQGLERSVYSQLMAESHARWPISLVSFNQTEDELTADFSEVSAFFSDLFVHDWADAASDLSDFIDVIEGVAPYTDELSKDLLTALEFEANKLPVEKRDSMLGIIRSGDNQLIGSDVGEAIEGYGGSDRIEGRGGDDDLRGGGGNDRLYGEGGNDSLNGGDGQDSLYGGSGNDILRGGSGDDDYLAGEAGNDTYLFGAGDGNTTIYNRDTGEGRNDVLRLLEGISAGDVRATRAGSNLLLTVASTGEVITVQRYFDGDAAGGFALNAIEFADGTVWDIDTVKGLVQQGTEGGDQLYGYAGADTLNGAGGNDTLNGEGGDDTLTGGEGNDRLNGQNGNDTLSGDAGDDRIYGNAGDDSLSGGEGRDFLYGGSGNDTLQGGSGANDYLSGEAGDDTYLFSAGDGNTTIYNRDTGAGRNDVLRLLEEIDPSDIRATRSSDNLLLTVQGTGEVITVQNYFNGDGAGGYALNAIEFAAGTVWDIDTVKGLVQQGTEGADQLYGYDEADTLSGAGGNDTLNGAGGDDSLNGGEGNDRLNGQDGNDTLSGGAGDDRLYGNAGDDSLSGGEGRDYLYGGSGNDTLQGGSGDDDFLAGEAGDDTYLFSVGDGSTMIYNRDTGEGRNDVLRLLEGVEPSDVRATRAGTNLLLTVASTGETITVQSYFNGDAAGGYALDAIEFADGTVWDIDTVKGLVQQGTDGADQLYGYAGADTLNGAGGNDTLYGAGGDDVLDGGAGEDNVQGQEGNDVVAGGAGDDRLYGNDGADTLSGGEGRDYLYGGDDNDDLQGGAGSDKLYGGNGSDILAGGTGNDDLRGDQGDDVYRFSKGAGADSIYDSSGQDRIEFTDVDSTEVVVRREGDHLRIAIPSTGDSVLIERQFNRTDTTAQSTSLETVDFADGVSWSFDDLMAEAVEGTEGDDVINGFTSDETINGGDGDDAIYGHEGADTILGGAGNDDLEGGEGQDALFGGAGDDQLRGGNAADALYGDEGSDALYGGEGSHRVYRCHLVRDSGATRG